MERSASGVLGSACVPRAGFGVTPKQAFVVGAAQCVCCLVEKSALFALSSRPTISSSGDTLAKAEFSSTRPVRALSGGRDTLGSAVINRFAGASAIAAKLLQQSLKVQLSPVRTNGHSRACLGGLSR